MAFESALQRMLLMSTGTPGGDDWRLCDPKRILATGQERPFWLFSEKQGKRLFETQMNTPLVAGNLIIFHRACKLDSTTSLRQVYAIGTVREVIYDQVLCQQLASAYEEPNGDILYSFIVSMDHLVPVNWSMDWLQHLLGLVNTPKSARIFRFDGSDQRKAPGDTIAQGLLDELTNAVMKALDQPDVMSPDAPLPELPPGAVLEAPARAAINAKPWRGKTAQIAEALANDGNDGETTYTEQDQPSDDEQSEGSGRHVTDPSPASNWSLPPPPKPKSLKRGRVQAGLVAHSPPHGGKAQALDGTPQRRTQRAAAIAARASLYGHNDENLHEEEPDDDIPTQLSSAARQVLAYRGNELVPLGSRPGLFLASRACVQATRVPNRNLQCYRAFLGPGAPCSIPDVAVRQITDSRHPAVRAAGPSNTAVGVFTSAPVRKAEVVGEITGSIVTAAELDDMARHTEHLPDGAVRFASFALEATAQWGQDALYLVTTPVPTRGEHPLGCINDYRMGDEDEVDVADGYEGPTVVPLLVLQLLEDRMSVEPHLFVQTARDLEAGEEITLDLGADFWAQLQSLEGTQPIENARVSVLRPPQRTSLPLAPPVEQHRSAAPLPLPMATEHKLFYDGSKSAPQAQQPSRYVGAFDSHREYGASAGGLRPPGVRGLPPPYSFPPPGRSNPNDYKELLEAYERLWAGVPNHSVQADASAKVESLEHELKCKDRELSAARDMLQSLWMRDKSQMSHR